MSIPIPERDIQPNSKHALGPGTYVLQGSLAENVTLTVNGNLLVDGDILDGTIVNVTGKLDVRGSVGKGAHLTAGAIIANDVHHGASITATDGDIEVQTLSSQIHLDASRNIHFTDGGEKVTAHAKGELFFHSTRAHADLKAAKIIPYKRIQGRVGAHSTITSTEEGIALVSVGKHCTVRSERQVYIARPPHESCTIHDYAHGQPIHASEIPVGTPFTIHRDCVIDGDVPAGANLIGRGNVTVNGTIRKNARCFIKGDLDCQGIEEDAKVSAATINTLKVGDRAELIATRHSKADGTYGGIRAHDLGETVTLTSGGSLRFNKSGPKLKAHARSSAHFTGIGNNSYVSASSIFGNYTEENCILASQTDDVTLMRAGADTKIHSARDVDIDHKAERDVRAFYVNENKSHAPIPFSKKIKRSQEKEHGYNITYGRGPYWQVGDADYPYRYLKYYCIPSKLLDNDHPEKDINLISAVTALAHDGAEIFENHLRMRSNGTLEEVTYLRASKDELKERIQQALGGYIQTQRDRNEGRL